MTEQEFDDKVKQIANLHKLTIHYAEYIFIKMLCGPRFTFGLPQHLNYRQILRDKEINIHLTEADLNHGRKLIEKDYRIKIAGGEGVLTKVSSDAHSITGGIKRGELNYLFAKTDPKKSLFYTAINTIAAGCKLKEFKLSEEEGSVKVEVNRKENRVGGEMKLFIFDYFHQAKPGVVFANDKEEAIKLIKEAGLTGLPDTFYSSVKEIEIPIDPTFVRYNAGE